eukprot:g3587.t1
MVFFSASCRMAGLRVRGYRQAASAAEIMSAAEIKRKLAIAIETDPREVLKKEVVKDPVLKAPLREGPRLRWGRGSSRSRARAEREAREATAMQRMQQSIGNSPIGLYPVYDIPRNVASSFVGTKVLQPASLRYALAQAAEDVKWSQSGDGAWVSSGKEAWPFLHDRVHEVLQILMMSEVWMKAFAEDPECQVEDLPPEMQSEFKRRAEQALDPNAKDDGYPPRKSSHQEFKASGTIAVVVQRCLKARLLVDEAADSWAEIGRGLFVAVSFTKSATEEKLGPAARFLLTAKLSRGESSEEAWGEKSEQAWRGIRRRYSQQLGKSRSHVLYDHFVQTLHAAAAELSEGRGPQILAGAFDGPQAPAILEALETVVKKGCRMKILLEREIAWKAWYAGPHSLDHLLATEKESRYPHQVAGCEFFIGATAPGSSRTGKDGRDQMFGYHWHVAYVLEIQAC